VCVTQLYKNIVVILCTTRVGYYCIHELLLHDLLRGCERNGSS